MLKQTIALNIFFLLFYPFLYGEEPKKPLHLIDAVDLAIHNNPILKGSLEKVQQSTAQISLNRSILFPNIYLSAGAAEKKDAATNPIRFYNGSAYSAFTSDAHLSQPLVQFGALSAIDSAKKDVEIQKLNTEISERNLINQVIQGFYQVVLASRNVNTLISEEKIVQESLKTAEKRERSGRGQLLDVLQIKTQISLIQSQIITARDLVKSASVTLASLMGDPDAKEVAVLDGLDVPELSVVDSNVNLKNSHLPELEQSKISLAQIDDQKKGYSRHKPANT